GVLLTPAIVGCLCDSDLSTNVRDGQSLGQIAVCFAQDMRDFLGGPSPAHESLRGSVYRRTPISAGPDFGEQATDFGEQANNLFQGPFFSLAYIDGRGNPVVRCTRTPFMFAITPGRLYTHNDGNGQWDPWLTGHWAN